MSLLPWSGMGPGHVIDTSPALLRHWLVRDQAASAGVLPALSSDSFLRHTCFFASQEQALSCHMYIRELNRTREHNEHWHWAIQGVQFLAWSTSQFDWLQLLCDCRHHLVMCVNHGSFPSAYLEGFILGSKRVLAMHVIHAAPIVPGDREGFLAWLFSKYIYLVSIAH